SSSNFRSRIMQYSPTEDKSLSGKLGFPLESPRKTVEKPAFRTDSKKRPRPPWPGYACYSVQGVARHGPRRRFVAHASRPDQTSSESLRARTGHVTEPFLPLQRSPVPEFSAPRCAPHSGSGSSTTVRESEPEGLHTGCRKQRI